MKTVTEFSGFFLRSALQLKDDLYKKKREEVQQSVSQVAPAPESATPAAATEGETPTPDAAVEAATPVAEAEVATEASIPSTEETPPAPEEQKKREDRGPRGRRGRGPAPRPKLPPITLTAEELSPLVAEKLNLEGERLGFCVQAVMAVDFRRAQDLKRVVVLGLAEGEKAPAHALVSGSHAFIAEYLPSLNPPRQGKPGKGRGDKRGRGGKKGRGKFSGKGRGDGRGGERRDERGNRGDRGRGSGGGRPSRPSGAAPAPRS